MFSKQFQLSFYRSVSGLSIKDSKGESRRERGAEGEDLDFGNIVKVPDELTL